MHPRWGQLLNWYGECAGAMSLGLRLTDLGTGKARGKRELRLSHEHLFSQHEFLSRRYSKDGTAVLVSRWNNAAGRGGTTMHADHRNQEASGDWPETILMFSALAALAIIAFWVLNS